MIDELHAAKGAMMKAHEALKEAARHSDAAALLLEQHGLTLRRLASDLNQIAFEEGEAAEGPA